MTKILLVNGPPRSGKDTVGEIVANLTGASVYKFAHALKLGTHGLFYGLRGDLTPLLAAHAMHANAFESAKDVRMERFFGLTPREAYIAVSEVFAKPVFGPRFFGEILAEQIENDAPKFAVVTDSGFLVETEILIKRFGEDNVTLVQLFRAGCEFSEQFNTGWIEKLVYNIAQATPLKGILRKMKDSRGYVKVSLRDFRISNNRSIDDLRRKIRENVLGAIGWK